MNSKLEYLHIPSLIDTIPSITQDSIISRTLFTDDQLKVVMFAFDAGQELSEHTASTPAIIHIVAGEAKIQLGHDVIDADTNTWIHMAANLSHSVRAKTPLHMLLLLIKS